MKYVRAFWIGLTFLALQSSGADAPEIAAQQIFASHKCSYTLPGPGWSWQNAANVPGAICVASNEAGVVAVLMAQRTPLDALGPEFVRGLEDSAVEPGETKKRSGKNLTFKGVPCYQMDMTLIKVQKTFSSRFFVAHGYAYTLQVIGDAEPVDKSPEYDAIMNGFAFTSPPVAANPVQKKANSDAYNAGRRVGQIFIYVLIGAVIIAVIRKVVS